MVLGRRRAFPRPSVRHAVRPCPTRRTASRGRPGSSAVAATSRRCASTSPSTRWPRRRRWRHLGRRGRRRTHADVPRAARADRPHRVGPRGTRRRCGRRGRALPADGARDGRGAVRRFAKLGAIFLPIFSGYGADAVAVRLADADAVALVTADGFTRRGKAGRDEGDADAAVAQVPTVHTVVVVAAPRTRRRADDERARRVRSPICRGTAYRHFAWRRRSTASIRCSSRTRAARPASRRARCTSTAASRVKIAEEVRVPDRPAPRRPPLLAHRHRLDHGTVGDRRRARERRHARACTTARPTFPESDRLWAFVERHACQMLGVSPTLIRALMAHGDAPVRAHDLSSSAHPRRQPASRGTRRPGAGTSTSSAVAAVRSSTSRAAPKSAPVSCRRTSCNRCRRVRSAARRSVWPSTCSTTRASRCVARSGELVCTKPWPGMTRGLWNDPQRYLDTYWSRCPNVWWHGDFASIDDRRRVVPAWPLRRHDQARGQAARAGRGRDRRRLRTRPSWRPRRSVCPTNVKGEVVWVFVVLQTRHTVCNDELRAENLRRST